MTHACVIVSLGHIIDHHVGTALSHNCLKLHHYCWLHFELWACGSLLRDQCAREVKCNWKLEL